MKLTEEQQAVYDAALDFIRDRKAEKQYFSIMGAAGTGKSTLLAKLAHELRGATLCAFTGKAASVLARKTKLPATTIHSCIYRFLGLDDEADPIFRQKIEAGAWRGMLALVDESSVIGQWLAADLLKTECKVVTCGDNDQLAPVRDTRFFAEADRVLKTVHRQAWDSAIIRQAHAVRAGNGYREDGEDFRVQARITQEQALAADMILCWRNATRMEINRISRAYRGLSGELRKGEPVMCLKNDHKKALLNGAVYTLWADRYNGITCVTNERGEEIGVKSWVEDTDAPMTPQELEQARLMPFAAAYCATVHKAQGSEWDRVILVDEYNKREDRERFLYTGITRAAKQIIVQRG